MKRTEQHLAREIHAEDTEDQPDVLRYAQMKMREECS